LHNNVSSAEHGGAVGNNPSALLYVSRIRITSRFTGTRLHNHVEPGFGERGEYGGNKRNPALSGIAFFRNPYDHAFVLSLGILPNQA
jgi:hypothetical protein